MVYYKPGSKEAQRRDEEFRKRAESGKWAGPRGQEYATGELALSFDKGTTESEARRIIESLGGTLDKWHDTLGAGFITINNPSANIEDDIKRFSAIPSVRHAGKNSRVYPMNMGIGQQPTQVEQADQATGGERGGAPDGEGTGGGEPPPLKPEPPEWQKKITEQEDRFRKDTGLDPSNPANGDAWRQWLRKSDEPAPAPPPAARPEPPLKQAPQPEAPAAQAPQQPGQIGLPDSGIPQPQQPQSPPGKSQYGTEFDQALEGYRGDGLDETELKHLRELQLKSYRDDPTTNDQGLPLPPPPPGLTHQEWREMDPSVGQMTQGGFAQGRGQQSMMDLWGGGGQQAPTQEWGGQQGWQGQQQQQSFQDPITGRMLDRRTGQPVGTGSAGGPGQGGGPPLGGQPFDRWAGVSPGARWYAEAPQWERDYEDWKGRGMPGWQPGGPPQQPGQPAPAQPGTPPATGGGQGGAPGQPGGRQDSGGWQGGGGFGGLPGFIGLPGGGRRGGPAQPPYSPPTTMPVVPRPDLPGGWGPPQDSAPHQPGFGDWDRPIRVQPGGPSQQQPPGQQLPPGGGLPPGQQPQQPLPGAQQDAGGWQGGGGGMGNMFPGIQWPGWAELPTSGILQPPQTPPSVPGYGQPGQNIPGAGVVPGLPPVSPIPGAAPQLGQYGQEIASAAASKLQQAPKSGVPSGSPVVYPSSQPIAPTTRQGGGRRGGGGATPFSYGVRVG